MNVNSLEKYEAKQSLKEMLSQAVYGAKPSILGGTARGAGIGAGIGGLGGIAASLTPTARLTPGGTVMPLREMLPKGLGGEPSLNGLLHMLSGAGAGATGAMTGAPIGGLAGLLRSASAKKGWLTRKKRINQQLMLGGAGAGGVGLAGLIAANS